MNMDFSFFNHKKENRLHNNRWEATELTQFAVDPDLYSFCSGVVCTLNVVMFQRE